MSRCPGDHTRVAARVLGGSATGNDDRSGEGVVPESPARIDDINFSVKMFLSKDLLQFAKTKPGKMANLYIYMQP